MSWLITPTYDGLVDDPDANAYLAAVQAADGQLLEGPVRQAVNTFIKGCKADGIWPAIKASCILAGARTLNGALVPLAGTAPTNFNFVSGDYNRKTGLVGNGSTKYLDSNRSNNADPQDSRHMSAFATSLETGRINPAIMGATRTPPQGRSFLTALNTLTPRTIQSALSSDDPVNSPSLTDLEPGFVGISRSTEANYQARFNATSTVIGQSSLVPSSSAIWIFARPGGSPNNQSAHRLAFYSIGEALDLALLDARVTALINAFGTAIP